MKNKKIIAVIGGSQANEEELARAEETGREIALRGAILVCGGLGGVMEAACRGAKQAGGLTLGILPGDSHETANSFVDIPVVTGVGHARNMIVVKTARAVIAVGGSYGTLSEISYALQNGIPVIGLNTWCIWRNNKEDKSIICVDSPAGAVDLAVEMMSLQLGG